MDNLRFAEVASHPSIAEALRATFGNVVPEGFEPLQGGLSKAALFKLTVGGRRYVLHHVLTPGPESDPPRVFACMTVAADRGLSPRVHYASARDGVCITDFVEGKTLGEWLRTTGGDCVDELGGLLASLHESPPFPPFVSIPYACNAFAVTLAARGGTNPFDGEHMALVEAMRAALAPHVTEAPCHNDLNPGNVMVDGARMWLVDWDAAGMGDPFHDLVTPGVFVLRTPELRARLLRAYLGRDPTAVERARLVLARALALTFYGLGFANVALARGPRGDAAPGPPSAPSALSDPGRFGEAIADEARRECASPECAAALVTLR
jgi:aminoglycoside phosphotransferase